LKVIKLGRRFIESVRFPFREVSEASGVEKGLGRPPYWEMVFWWTRKPLISARAVIAGCLLPEDTNPANFLRSIGKKPKVFDRAECRGYPFKGGAYCWRSCPYNVWRQRQVE